MSVRPPP